MRNSKIFLIFFIKSIDKLQKVCYNIREVGNTNFNKNKKGDIKMEKLFSEFNLDYLKKVDIQNVGRYVMTRGVNIKEEYKDNYWIDETDEDWLLSIGLDEFDVLIDETDFEDYGDFNEEEFNDFIKELIVKENHYLMIGYKSNWRGQTGYKIVDDIKDIFVRDYECSQYVIGGTMDKRVLSIKESHHDCPMGFECLVVAITDEEFEKLDSARFDDIIEFGDKMRSEVEYI